MRLPLSKADSTESSRAKLNVQTRKIRPPPPWAGSLPPCLPQKQIGNGNSPFRLVSWGLLRILLTKMLEPLLHKSPAPPAAVASPSLPRRAAPPPPVALSTPPPRSSRHQSTAAPSPPPPTPPRSATAPSSPTPTITARSASLPLGPAPPPRFPVSAGRRGVVHYFVGLAWSRRGATPPRQPCGGERRFQRLRRRGPAHHVPRSSSQE